MDVRRCKSSPEVRAYRGIRRNAHVATPLFHCTPRSAATGSAWSRGDAKPADNRRMDRFCAWCGTELAPWYSGLYCSDAHRDKQRLHRRKLDGQPIKICPKPYKKAFTHRGFALRKAVTYQQYPYLCACSAWHLTSRPNHLFDTALRVLIEEMLVAA
jgi:hypothetical protein